MDIFLFTRYKPVLLLCKLPLLVLSTNYICTELHRKSEKLFKISIFLEPQRVFSTQVRLTSVTHYLKKSEKIPKIAYIRYDKAFSYDIIR